MRLFSWPTAVVLVCGIVFIWLFAGTIVLSLIPVYLSDKSNFDRVPTHVQLFELRYATALTNTTGYTVGDIHALNVQLNKELHVGTLNVLAVKLPSFTNTKRKRRAISDCASQQNSTGDVLIIQFTLSSDRTCATAKCRATLIEKVKTHIQTKFSSLSLPVTLSNGTSISLLLSLCSVSAISTNTNSKLTCVDGIKNQDESDADCGGSVCAARCGINQQCTKNSDCVNNNCHQTQKTCQEPSCSDGNKNQDETDIDCGDSVCKIKCDLDYYCNKNADCINNNCHPTNKICQVASCDDGNKNQDETGIDCGGSICTRRCDLNQACSNNSDCSNGNCYVSLKICQVPSCCDGNKNQDETDIDCGGSMCGARCVLTQICSNNSDCANDNCHQTNKTCQEPSCPDGNQNQDETDVDCGGASCKIHCALNQTCAENFDCANNNCHQRNKTCQDPSCDDGNKNQDETGVDCGGFICGARCDLNQVCSNNSDCSNGNCHRSLNLCQEQSCNDGNKNQDETDVDCGGFVCGARCNLTQVCSSNSDCANGNCHQTNKTCQEPSCFDGNQNQDETDVDCGGISCKIHCALNRTCGQNYDCANNNCHKTNQTCQVPSCDDGNQNEDETDVDCGGTVCSARCGLNQVCSRNSDCSNGNCYASLKICQAPSCCDGNRNQDETDVDCGGSACPARCNLTQVCSSNSDCLYNNCHKTIPSCDDGNKNQDETGPDCGGHNCTMRCALGITCSTNSDCNNGNCHFTLKTCENPSCPDGNQNQGETDVDCGGSSCTILCALNKTCTQNSDCDNGNCHHSLHKCSVPSCDDRNKNQDETDADCGGNTCTARCKPSCDDGNLNQAEVDIDCSGPCATKCVLNQTCTDNADCVNGNCHHVTKKCSDLSCEDGNKNQGEGDIDCGGPCPTTCNITQTCAVNTDCANGNCHHTKLTCELPSCGDGNRNLDETDVDCGGSNCTKRCTTNNTCHQNFDCDNGNCHHSSNTCQPFSCDDGNKNQGEGDIDCGGPCPTMCNITQTCTVNTDCANGNCHHTNLTCQNPSCNDGNVNQNETDVDCGGPVCGNSCNVDQACTQNSDCANGNCHHTNLTCKAPSCNDGNKNQDEGDIDCGGVCTTKCTIGHTCLKNTDCVNGSLRLLHLFLSCDDGNKNQDETGVDCGGKTCAARCALGVSCLNNSDCNNTNCHQASHLCDTLSCSDGNKNQNETDVDCGGLCNTKCAVGKNCTQNSDCTNQNCHHTSLTCTVPSCDDGNQNQNETDVDCGGLCSTKCLLNHTCLVNSDCANGNCHHISKKCSDPSCDDGNKNQNETDIDCGGLCSNKCTLHSGCANNVDCANGNCHHTSNTCENPSCTDGNQNQNETDIDCGGLCLTKCALNQTCKVNVDCANSNCHTTQLKCSAESCDDGNKNQQETDIDCGGTPCAVRCAINMKCLVNTDCGNANCHRSQLKCLAPSCGDGNLNQNETDIDCGGICGATCKVNQTCSINTDCAIGNCHRYNHTCQPVSCFDGNKNQAEGDVDCGTPCTLKCNINQTCLVNGDCINTNCNQYTKVCEDPSCVDGNINQAETDVDCGGTCNSTCVIGKACAVNTDCVNGNCHQYNHKCQNPSCSDGNLNQNETDLDCGGVCVGTCTLNKVCKINGDCANGNCNKYNHTCQPYSCSDGNKNQGEGDVDCGGPCTAALCSLNQTCNVNSDCTNGNCNQYNHTCQRKWKYF
ncbi:unnamed protein product [Adineta ricciae]|uniref:Uncharacterized protein n=1 Tax=Adineta ricciae TaxID=249248 RepID=A0A815FL93_ADIRI|nr:unnamed protein product [Adineta ricciae]